MIPILHGIALCLAPLYMYFTFIAFSMLFIVVGYFVVALDLISIKCSDFSYEMKRKSHQKWLERWEMRDGQWRLKD